MEGKLKILDMKDFVSAFPMQVDTAFGLDFFLSTVTMKDLYPIIHNPCRLDFYVMFFCTRGNLNVDVNLNSYTLKENSLLLNVPGNIIRISEGKEFSEDASFFILALSKEFVSSMRIDLSNLFTENMEMLSHPHIVLHREDRKLLVKYISLAEQLLKSDILSKKEAVSYLVSSSLYTMASVWIKRTEKQIKGKTQSARSNLIFDQFIKLVTEHHNTERGVSFYAYKLCLTPKYLSKLIKNISGRSAPNWIDSFVILEAKNMLKYSNISIKEIVFRLNFPNQSVFYKFFKTHTGMTPSKYRKSK